MALSSSTSCYAWYYVTTGATADASLSQSALATTPGGTLPNALPSSTSHVLGKVWIRSRDTSASDAAERASPGTAWHPSATSRQITTLFQQLGEVPSLSLASTGAPARVTGLRFMSQGSYWLVNITTTYPASLVLHVANSQVTVMGCAASAESFSLSVVDFPSSTSSTLPKSPGSSLTLSQAITLSSAPGALDLLRLDPCALNRALLRLGTGSTAGALVYVDRGFDGTSGALASLTSNSAAIRYSAINPLGPFSLASDNSLVLPNGTAWTAPSLLNLGALTSLTPASACDILTGYGISRLSTAIAAWPTSGNTLIVVLPRVSALAPTFASAKAALAAPLTAPPAPGFARWDWPTVASTALDVYPLQLPDVAQVHDIDIEHATGALLALVRTTSGVDQLVAVDLVHNATPSAAYSVIATYSGAQGSVVLDAGTKSPKLQLTLARSAGRHMFISGDTLVYSSNGGVTGIPITFTTRNPSVIGAGTTALGPSEWVAQVATVPAALSADGKGAAVVQVGVGRFAVLTSTNRIFIGMAGEREALEVPSPLAAGTPAQLVFGADGSLSAIRAKTSAPWYETVSVPVAEDLSVSAWNVPGVVCPYLSMSVNVPPEKYLDAGQSFTLTATLTTGPTQPMQSAMAAVGNSSLLSLSTSRQPVQYVVDTLQSTTHVTVSASSWDRQGFATVTLGPQLVSLGCAARLAPRTTAMVRATCPPDRRIALRASAPSVAAPVLVNCTENPGATLQVTAAEGNWRDWDTGKAGVGSKSTQFSCGRFGQPQSAYYSYQWAPVLDVYEGDKVVGNVTADFALVEVTGRSTFGYILTADTAKCTRAPQGASSMLQNGGTWSRNNYRPCTSSIDPTFTSTQAASTPYEIFNATNGNKLTWSNSENAVYLFRATVLDPQFSYCALSTEFAIQVYGAPLPVGTQVGIVVGFIVAVLLALAVSYWIYRRNKTKEKTD